MHFNWTEIIEIQNVKPNFIHISYNHTWFKKALHAEMDGMKVGYDEICLVIKLVKVSWLIVADVFMDGR